MNFSSLLKRCSAIIGDETEEVQGYTFDCLLTLSSFLDTGPSVEHYQKVWWAGICCLHSPNPWEFELGLDILLKIIHQLGIVNLYRLEIISNMDDVSWTGENVFKLCLYGSKNPKIEKKCLEFINSINMISSKEAIVDQYSDRIMYGILSNLPRMVMTFDHPSDDLNIYGVAESLSSLCFPAYDNLGHVLVSFSKRKFRSRDDFTSQISHLLLTSFADHTEIMIEALFQFLFNQDSELREIVLNIILGFIRSMGATQFSSLGSSCKHFWYPLVSLMSSLFHSSSFTKVLDMIMMTKSVQSSSDLKLVFGSTSLNAWKTEFDQEAELKSQKAIANCRKNFEAVSEYMMKRHQHKYTDELQKMEELFLMKGQLSG
jgi:hypothetical protein